MHRVLAVAEPRGSPRLAIMAWAAMVALMCALVVCWQPVAWGAEDGLLVRVKDIARVQGVRDNQLTGLGLVVGLNGTGDSSSSQVSTEMVTNMLARFGVPVDSHYFRVRNVAAVLVTATLPGFARSGSSIDVTVASLGDARSLQGGVLLQTPLQGADGAVYAVAQGPLLIGGQSAPAGQVQRVHSLTARVPGGAIVEQEVPAAMVGGDRLVLVLNTPDFATASRVAQAIDTLVAPGTARALDHTAIEVAIPPEHVSDPVAFIAAVEEIPVAPDTPARVVVNERTGTVIIGGSVRVAPVAITHGHLSVRIDTPGANVVPRWQQGDQERATLLPGGTVEDVVKGLNAIGATPQDVISILQVIRAAGALFGELLVL